MAWQQRRNKISTGLTDGQLRMVDKEIIKSGIGSRSEWLYRIVLQRIDPTGASDPPPVKMGRPPLNRPPQ